MTGFAFRPGTATRCPVEDSSQVPLARSVAAGAAVLAGLGRAVADTVALAATELAENLHRHAVGGELTIMVSETPAGAVLTLVALDRGPGVADFSRCLEDGYSTAGTLGAGLGGVRRLASTFDAVSEAGVGTVVVAGFRSAPAGRRAPEAAFDVAAMGYPIQYEEVSGDSWVAVQRGDGLFVTVADGLGHGRDAAVAATAAVDPELWTSTEDPGAVLVAANARLRATRGAAVTSVALSGDTLRSGGELVSAGLGNVSLLVAGRDGGSRRVLTAHGTAGARPKATASRQTTAVPAGGVVVLHSDGLTSRWSFQGRTELLRHGAQAIAAALWRDHVRGSDDSVVLVIRASDAGGPG